MDQKLALKIRLELVWWLVTVLILLAVLLPILSQVEDYRFLGSNILFVVVLITMARHLFLLRHSLLDRYEVPKIVLVFLCIPLGFLLIQNLNSFQSFLDEEGINSFLNGLPYPKQQSLSRYIHSEMLLFGTGSILTTLLMPIKLIVSIWRKRNRGEE